MECPRLDDSSWYTGLCCCSTSDHAGNITGEKKGTAFVSGKIIVLHRATSVPEMLTTVGVKETCF